MSSVPATDMVFGHANCNGLFYRQLFIGVDPNDDNYMPYRVIVNGMTDSGTMTLLKDTFIETWVDIDSKYLLMKCLLQAFQWVN